MTSKIYAYFIFLLASISVVAQTIPANNALIEYSGRIDFSNPLDPTFSYSGVSIRAQFQGTSVSAILEDAGSSNYYNIIVDGVVTQRLQLTTGRRTYLLANGLANTQHEIEIYRITESLYGKTKFGGFVLDAGKTLVSLPKQRTRIIEYVGNSVTCGAGIEGAAGSAQSNTNQNHYLSYAAITSRYFNALHFVASKSGVGLFLNYGGFVNNYTESPSCMKNYYNRMHYNDAAPLYDFIKKPDLICVNLGTNDFARGVDEAKFEAAYYSFIDTLQARNSGTDIICLVGPMMSGYNLNHIKPIVQRVATATNARNRGRVFYFELSQQGALGVGSDNHPNVAQHAKNAQELINFIKTIKGWDAATPVNELPNDTTNTVFPNPTKELLSIKMTANAHEMIQVDVLDLEGRIQTTKQFLTTTNGDNVFELDVKSLANGTYFIRTTTKQGLSKTNKVVIAK